MTFDPARVQAVLFDVDGTLADTDDDYIRRAGKFIHRLHFLFPQRDPTNFLRWSLMIAESPLTLLMGLPDWIGVDDELARFFDRVAARRDQPQSAASPEVGLEAPALVPPPGHFVLMQGVDEMLAHLAARYPLAIVTARGERAARAFVEQFGLVSYFRAVASAQTAPHTKPYPDPVLWAAHTLGVPVENCVMVGDTTVDVLAGRRAGAQTVGVLCGFGQREELERSGADLILENTADLGPLLLG